MFPTLGIPQRPKSISSGYQIYEHSYFGGAWTAPDRATVDQRGALAANNVRFFNKQVETRYGWGVAISYAAPASTGILGLFNWLSDIGNYLVWVNPTNTPSSIYFTKVSDNPPTIASASIPAAFKTPVFAPFGPRLYVANWQSLNTGPGFTTASPAVVTWDGANFQYDNIIPGPASTAATGIGVQIPLTAPTEPAGTGIVTAGIHNLGIRMLHRSGFLGRPGPDTSTSTNPTPSTFAPIVFTSSGGKAINWSFTPVGVWPADVVQVQVLMSPVNNPNRYFLVPGAVQNVTGGAATPINITINIDDPTLEASASTLECTDSLNFYTASATGNAYMKCIAVVNIGTRMLYISQLPDSSGNTFSVVFASDPGEPQQISLSQHVIQLPNQLAITSVFSVNGAIYLAGPHWTYYTQDNGQTPVNWSAPQLVDGRKGAVAPNCVEVATSAKYAWVGDKTGLYYFDGSFGDLPISYNGSEWSTLQIPSPVFAIKDDPLRHRVHATVPGQPKILGWDYTAGMGPYQVRPYSTTVIGGATTGSFNDASIEMVQNDLFSTAAIGLKAPELWVGAPADNASFGNTLYIFREKNPAFDSNVYRDDGNGGSLGVHSFYETCIFPVPGGENDLLAHVGAKIRITGAGTMQPKVFNFDGTAFAPLTTTTLSSSGGRIDFRSYYISNNGFVYLFEQSALDSHFTLSEISMYYNRFGSLL